MVKRLPIALSALALLATACVRTEGPAAPRPTRSPGSRPPQVRLIARNLPLFPGAERALRITFMPFEDASFVLVDARPLDARITICPITGLRDPLPDLSRCRREVGNGVREPISRRGMRGVALLSTSDREVTADVTIDYDEAGRQFEITVPLFRPPPGTGRECDDNECNPFFEVRPVRSGRFTATARWEGGEATLVLLEGAVLGRSKTASSVPYREPARTHGSAPLRISTRLSAPAEYALAIRHRGRPSEMRAIRDLVIEARWP